MAIIKLQNDRTAELVDFAARNVDGAGSITQNLCASWKTDLAASTNGINATLPAAANGGAIGMFAGVATSTIGINNYGLVRAYGYYTSLQISQEIGSITINAGDLCVPIAGAVGCSSIGGMTFGVAYIRYVTVGNTLAISAQVTLDNCFVRAL